MYIKNNVIKSYSESLTVNKSGRDILSLNLPIKKNIEIKDGEKSLVLEIEGYKCRVIKSDCPKKICFNQGWSNETIICAPLKICVDLKRKINKKFDAITK